MTVRHSRDADGVGWIVFDDPAKRVNVLDAAALAALEAALDALSGEAVRAVVVLSGKENAFIAGADLHAIAALPDAAAATEFSRRGQRVLQRLADFPMPVVCSIDGACVGGGFELALACHWRLASDAPATRLGLPETSLGTIPGWGGCVRLPRLIGVLPALQHLVDARLVDAATAAKSGLVHEIAPALDLRAHAKHIALKLAAEGAPPHPPRAAIAPETIAALRQKIVARTRGHLPAPLAAIDAVTQGAALPVQEALEVEARFFGEVTAGEVCKNLIRVFFLREAAKKRTLEGWFEREANAPVARPPGQRVGVIGAGVMGSGIAQCLAARGFEVVLRDVSTELVARGAATVRRLFAAAVERGNLSAGEANAALHRIRTTTAWEGFAECDFVLEAIVEDAAVKRRLFSEVAAVARDDAVLASNTSALPIEEIAGHVPKPDRTVGIHFFNPVARMPLVELIVGQQTSASTADRALALATALGKSPVICRSSPGFLVTRVLFFYLNAAVRLWEEGVPTAHVDAAMREWGWPMGPLRLMDEVGLDVTSLIFDELAHYFPQRFRKTHACARLVRTGLLGRKGGAGDGFYRYPSGREVPNPRASEIADVTATRELRADAIQERVMGEMVGEASRCLGEGVVKSADDVDFALLSGAGFPAWRGGLMHWARSQRFTGAL